MTTPTPAPPPRDRSITFKVDPDEYTEVHLVAAHLRMTLSAAVRFLVRREAERIRAEREVKS